MIVVILRYQLHRDTCGFVEATNQIVTIPAGVTITVSVVEHTPVGLCNVAWEGKTIEAFLEDVQRNGSMIYEANIA